MVPGGSLGGTVSPQPRIMGVIVDANLSSPLPDLDGKTVFITGGASGMGKNIAAGVLEKGGQVVILDISEDNIAVATKDLGEEDRVAFYHGSVERKSDVAAAFALAAERFGTVHHLVNCAGAGDLSLVMDTPEENWDWVVDVCLKGTFLCTQAFARQAIHDGAGRTIVNISSLNAVASADGMAAYCAAKAGVRSLGEVYAGELGKYGIRVNTIGPGSTNTPMGPQDTPMMPEFVDRTLIHPRRLQEASDIADVAFWLMSPASQRITGHFIAVDGGNHVRGLFSYWDKMADAGWMKRPENA
jgi:3-oxoacyl-[acyl-carrier protein] reductase